MSFGHIPSFFQTSARSPFTIHANEYSFSLFKKNESKSTKSPNN